MDQQTPQRKISAVVPAYNEAARIGKVLEVLASYPKFCEVIVVDDGSEDATAEIARRYKTHVIRNAVNRGKAAVLEQAISRTQGEILFFCDADISGLTHQMIDEIILPVAAGEVDMFVGMRNRKIYFLSHILTLVPIFGGERALTKELWHKVPAFYKKRFRIEAALNFYAKYYGNGFEMKIFKNLSQTIKEKKYGLIKGMRHRILMMADVVAAAFKLHFVHIPATIQSIRITLGALLSSLIGLAIGALVLIGTYVGPRAFVLRLFREELMEDPDNAPLAHFLLYITSVTSVDVLVFIGWTIIGINLMVIFLQLSRLTLLVRSTPFTFGALFRRLKHPKNKKVRET